ncbi:MAG: EamA family transporter [Ilumatobacter sp.]|uniref:EamA family transporter n=1 Tax=Ilumatobacter sp. TaxID=1967498 RepID=UPI001D97F8FE|nr:EamA family transporter [Ilumatobacter sp.]MBT5277949.1 EamA family transporter [Ilumatobacter sp.]MBT5553128.1 EamA family transporter [Ilumatobacter sp.]MBT5865840.1 EamA family transporter [Ilumatobacter sp.]MDG0977061.1 EamA family transporter [Ilumatobacter sp.]
MQSATSTPASGGPIARWLSTAQPEALFVLSAVAQYIGAAIAVLLFDQVEPQTVAWFRIIGASIALLAVSRGWRSGWTRPQLISVAVFGITTALMNICFYLAIDRIDLGKGVTIEFIGPITVAAVATRSLRNGVALAFAIVGVVVLGGVEVADNLDGLFFILLASALWAGYIVLGSRVAQVDRGVAGLGLGLCIGAIVTTPIGAPWSGPVWLSPTLLAACLLVGVFSNAIGYGIDQFTMRRIPIRRFSLLLALLPVTASVIGWIALDQQPSGLDIIGIALVLVGVAVQERDEIERVERVVRTDPA